MFEHAVRTMLVVDDQRKVLEAIKSGVERKWPEWRVEVYSSGAELLARLADSTRSRPHLVSIDLGLPPDTDGTTEGIKLLKATRQMISGLPLLTHSANTLAVAALKEIVMTPASFIRTRDPHGFDRLEELIPMLAEGYLVCAPSAVTHLSEVFRSNPLDQEQWALLALLAVENPSLSNEKIAKALKFESTTSLQDKLKQIALVLEAERYFRIDTTATANKYRPHLVAFYKKYHEQFGR